MNPYMQLITGAVIFIAVFAVLLIYEGHKRRKMFLKMIRRKWGAVPDREYQPAELEKISHYFRRNVGEEFVIDDITWNDLDMDRIYMMINQTVSSPGEDKLYDMLRKPVFQEEVLKAREETIRLFEKEQTIREELMLMLLEIGRTRSSSLSDTLYILDEAPRIKTLPHIFLMGAEIASLLWMIFDPVRGFTAFLILFVVSISVYYGGNAKKEIDLYLTGFESIQKILSASDKMEKISHPGLKSYMETIARGKKAFSSFRKRAFWFAPKNSISGNPAQAVLDYIRMIFHVDIILYNSTLDFLKSKKQELFSMMDTIGQLDALISIASFRQVLPYYCYPKFCREDNCCLEAEDLYHPLIANPVANSITARGGILVTGSNASGKSTFLKNTAVNSILAQTMGICCCSKYRAPMLKVMTSMALRDDLSEGDSYFIVELKSIKRILEEKQKNEPLLCIVDEVLRGTNTIERIAASSRILKALTGKNILCFAATHDIELSYILEEYYRNYHFDEEICQEKVLFPYILKEGRALSRNAIKLLEVMGYEKDIVKSAREAAKEFEETGVWTSLKGECKC